MSVLRFAAVLTIVGAVCLVLGAALYDVRIGLLVAGILCLALGFLVDEGGRRG